MQLTCPDKSSITKVVEDIVGFAAGEKIWLFEGQMGAGKTTFIKEVCSQLGVVDDTSSPTFSLVNVYEDEKSIEYYHFDFYRLESEEEALDIGCEEYFYSGQFCFLEWAERIPHLIPSQFLKISITLDAENNRLISLSKHE